MIELKIVRNDSVEMAVTTWIRFNALQTSGGEIRLPTSSTLDVGVDPPRLVINDPVADCGLDLTEIAECEAGRRGGSRPSPLPAGEGERCGSSRDRGWGR